MRAQIIGTGSCLPEKIVTNDFLSTIVETSDEWISSRTGIRQRHIAINETTASMSTEAGKKALESAGVKAEDLRWFQIRHVWYRVSLVLSMRLLLTLAQLVPVLYLH